MSFDFVKCERKVSNIGSDLEYISDKINLPKIGEKGMVQYFYHSPDSKLPLRDIFERQKPEPHIEFGAENYLSKCYQPNKKEDFITGGHVCIMGKTFIYSFDDSILVKNIFDKNFAQSENKGKTYYVEMFS